MKPKDNPYNQDSADHTGKKGLCQHPPGFLKTGDSKDGYRMKCIRCGKTWRS